MDKLIFIVGFIIFSIYLGCLVYVISTQNKIQETLEDEDPELASAKLRDEDYQLAYAIDILKGLSAIEHNK